MSYEEEDTSVGEQTLYDDVTMYVSSSSFRYTKFNSSKGRAGDIGIFSDFFLFFGIFLRIPISSQDSNICSCIGL
jgi:hypothetical protein